MAQALLEERERYHDIEPDMNGNSDLNEQNQFSNLTTKYNGNLDDYMYNNSSNYNSDAEIKSSLTAIPDDCLINGDSSNAMFYDPQKDDDGDSTTANDMRYTAIEGRYKLSCEVCDKTFTNEKSLRDHRKRHLGITYKCELCFKILTEKKNLRMHKMTHYGTQFICPECDEGFVEKIHLVRHSLIHINKQMYLCEECDNVLVHTPDLRSHCEKHPNMEPSFICIMCHYRCSSLDQLEYHSQHHQVKPIDNVRHSCPNCDASFRSAAYLKWHRDTNHLGTRFECNICMRTYTSQSTYRKHKCRADIARCDKPTSFDCDVCGKSFPRIYSKNRHMLSHSAVKKFQCALCDKQFNRSDKFKYHLKMKHHMERSEYDQNLRWKQKIEKQRSNLTSDKADQNMTEEFAEFNDENSSISESSVLDSSTLNGSTGDSVECVNNQVPEMTNGDDNSQ